MSQQTAMQQLWEWIDANCHEDNFNINDARDMSLELEKEQISEAYRTGVEEDIYNNPLRTGEQYYNETFNK